MRASEPGPRSQGEQVRVWTIADILRWTTDRFGELSASPRLDAEVLLAHCLSSERIRLYVDYAKPLSQTELAQFRQMVRRRLAHEPVAHITGQREFWSLSFAVDQHVLIPRPETELLVEQALTLLKPRLESAPRVIDVGCGSGAIAVALCHELPNLDLIASDLSPAALRVAQVNTRRHAVTPSLLIADLLEPFGRATFDVVLANLPYIAASDLEQLQPEVARHEPKLALDGGDDGLDCFRRLIPQAARCLRPDGAILLEIGVGQGASVKGLLQQHGFDQVTIVPDLAGLERVVRASRP